MGQLVNFSPAFAGVRLRDDYGAIGLGPASSVTPLKNLSLNAKFPCGPPAPGRRYGGLNHVA